MWVAITGLHLTGQGSYLGGERGLQANTCGRVDMDAIVHHDHHFPTVRNIFIGHFLPKSRKEYIGNSGMGSESIWPQCL